MVPIITTYGCDGTYSEAQKSLLIAGGSWGVAMAAKLFCDLFLADLIQSLAVDAQGRSGACFQTA